MFDDACRDFHQSLVAALQTLDEPACLLQIVAQVVVVIAAVGAAYQRRVVRVNTNFWRCVWVQLYQPASGVRVFGDDHVWDDIGGRWWRDI